ncbi:hypothetical protein [Brachyspira sp.]|uniref:hypothetical protein n=1 Tax=Brachyspira sp. TaxID=1977261 RepID=UPI0026136272|nr:hypothetical protein [Brachyspira sp.]
MYRIKSALKYHVLSALILSIVYTLFIYFNTDFLMKLSEETLSTSKNIMRTYFILFSILPFNI